MRHGIVIGFFVIASALALPAVVPIHVSAGSHIIRLDPRFDMLVPSDARLEKIADGFTWVEGPVWQHEGGALLFSDIPNNTIFKWKILAG